MVKLGTLVKSKEGKALASVVKISSYDLHTEDSWKEQSHRAELDPTIAIRPGFVVSVRWQNEIKNLTHHVFYDTIKESIMDIGKDSVRIELVS